VSLDPRPATIIIDLDGTCIKHHGSLDAQLGEPELLPGVKEKFLFWERTGCKIIILTGRKESMRQRTIEQIEQVGLFFDQLIMGVGGGIRILINDKKPEGSSTAFAENVTRNSGLEKLCLTSE
jgi:hydroxymethylpyrimidine pyrophosphatase-like HAD family hydrolase